MDPTIGIRHTGPSGAFPIAPRPQEGSRFSNGRRWAAAAAISVSSIALSTLLSPYFSRSTSVGIWFFGIHVTMATLWPILPRPRDFTETESFFSHTQPFVVQQLGIARNPQLVLKLLVEHLQRNGNPSKLEIRFAGEAGLDHGGLGRQCIADLFSALSRELAAEMNQEMNQEMITEIGSTKYRSTLPLTSEEERTYKRMGTLMMFCLNASNDYLIGPIFETGIYEAIKAFPDALLDTNFQNLLDDDAYFESLMALYEAAYRDDESEQKTVQTMKRYLEPWNNDTPKALLLEHALPEHIREGHLVQKALRKHFVTDLFAPVLARLHAIAQGMRDAPFQSIYSWKHIREMDSCRLQELLQGTVEPRVITAKLVFRQVSDEKREWVKQWIATADKPLLRQFLQLIYGTPSIGQKEIIICNRMESSVRFETCFNTLVFPFDAVTSQQEFTLYLNAAISGKKDFTIN